MPRTSQYSTRAPGPLVALLVAAPIVALAQSPTPPLPSPPVLAAPAAVTVGAVLSPEDRAAKLQAAQVRAREAMREIAELSSGAPTASGSTTAITLDGATLFPPNMYVGPPWLRTLGLLADATLTRDGLRVTAAMAGGPAAAAGLKSGDRILAINATPLTDLDAASTMRRFAESLNTVKPGDRVTLKIGSAKAGGDAPSRDVELTALAAPPLRTPPTGGMGGMTWIGGSTSMMPPPSSSVTYLGNPDRIGPNGVRIGSFPGPLAELLGMGIPGLDLVTLSPALGNYFAAKDGVLVASAPARGAWSALRDGDVIELIDGRTPTSGPHATRILRSYQKGEKIAVRVLRERKRTELQMEAPATDELTVPGSRLLNYSNEVPTG